MSELSDRRRHPRTPVTLLVQHDGEEIDYATDLSPGGLFIQTRRPATRGATVQVQFSPNRDSNLVHAFCRVARVTPEGMGAAFLALDPEATALVARALA